MKISNYIQLSYKLWLIQLCSRC